MHTSRHTPLAALVAALTVAPAWAGNGHGKHGGGKHAGKPAVVQKHAGKHHGGKHARRDDGRHHVYNDGRRYHSDTRVMGSNGCPPGLAKKHNGCLPPGQAKKLAVGHPIPPGAVYVIPQRVLSTLPPPPLGYRYAIVNDQLVMVSSGNIVVDIIRSLLG
jgi:hypothetical protein